MRSENEHKNTQKLECLVRIKNGFGFVFVKFLQIVRAHHFSASIQSEFSSELYFNRASHALRIMDFNRREIYKLYRYVF